MLHIRILLPDHAPRRRIDEDGRLRRHDRLRRRAGKRQA